MASWILVRTQPGPALTDGYPGGRQVAGVLVSGDDPDPVPDVCHQRAEVDACIAHTDPESVGTADGVAQPGRFDQSLGRNAAVPGAFAAESGALDEQDCAAFSRDHLGGGEARRTGSDDADIEHVPDLRPRHHTSTARTVCERLA